MRVRLSIACFLGAALAAAATSAVGATVTEKAKLTASDGTDGDQFGYSSVPIGLDTVVVSARPADVGGNPCQGAAYVFQRSEGGQDAWGEVTKLTASDGAPYDYFGQASIDVDTVVVGASGDDSRGSAYMFERDAGGADNWGEVAKLTASDGAENDLFGDSVCIGGDTVVVGARCADVDGYSNRGAAYVFERNAGGPNNWGEVAKLSASDGASNEEFGWSVSMDGDTIAVGAIGSVASQGKAYIFERNAGGTDNWGEVARLAASDSAADDHFGFSVSVDTDTVVIGALRAWGEQGSAYIFERNEGGADNWGQVAKLVASDGAANDDFGGSCSACGDVIVVGARGADVGGNIGQGAAYVFERNEGGQDAWGEFAKLTASDGTQSDWFGVSVSASGDTVVVGAGFDIVGGNVSQGSAYVFKRTATPFGGGCLPARGAQAGGAAPALALAALLLILMRRRRAHLS